MRDGDEMSGYHKFPQRGTVVIEDDVELGAHTCVDRAALGQTRIGRGTKIDNLVHVGHNCDIGERVVIAAQTGISGSVIIEDDVVIGGQVGFGDHIRVQSGAVIGSKAGILPGKIVRPGVWWGIPIQPLDEYKRMNAHLGRLPQMREEIKELRKTVRRTQERSGVIDLRRGVASGEILEAGYGKAEPCRTEGGTAAFTTAAFLSEKSENLFSGSL